MFGELIYCPQSAALGKVVFTMIIEAKEDNFSGGRKTNPIYKEYFHVFESMGVNKLGSRFVFGAQCIFAKEILNVF